MGCAGHGRCMCWGKMGVRVYSCQKGSKQPGTAIIACLQCCLCLSRFRWYRALCRSARGGDSDQPLTRSETQQQQQHPEAVQCAVSACWLLAAQRPHRASASLPGLVPQVCGAGCGTLCHPCLGQHHGPGCSSRGSLLFWSYLGLGRVELAGASVFPVLHGFRELVYQQCCYGLTAVWGEPLPAQLVQSSVCEKSTSSGMQLAGRTRLQCCCGVMEQRLSCGEQVLSFHWHACFGDAAGT